MSGIAETTYFIVSERDVQHHGLQCWDECGTILDLGDVAVMAVEGISSCGRGIECIVCPACYEKRIT